MPCMIERLTVFLCLSQGEIDMSATTPVGADVSDASNSLSDAEVVEVLACETEVESFIVDRK